RAGTPRPGARPRGPRPRTRRGCWSAWRRRYRLDVRREGAMNERRLMGAAALGDEDDDVKDDEDLDEDDVDFEDEDEDEDWDEDDDDDDDDEEEDEDE